MMPLWFDMTAILVVGFIMVGIVVGYVGIFLGKDKIAIAGGVLAFVPTVLFVILAAFAIPLLMR